MFSGNNSIGLLILLILLLSGCGKLSSIVTPSKEKPAPSKEAEKVEKKDNSPSNQVTETVTESDIKEPPEASSSSHKLISIKKSIPVANVRSDPSLGQNIISHLNGGNVVEKIDGNAKWSKISFTDPEGNPVTGWISNSVVENDQKKSGNRRKSPQSMPRKTRSGSQDELSPM